MTLSYGDRSFQWVTVFSEWTFTVLDDLRVRPCVLVRIHASMCVCLNVSMCLYVFFLCVCLHESGRAMTKTIAAGHDGKFGTRVKDIPRRPFPSLRTSDFQISQKWVNTRLEVCHTTHRSNPPHR